MCNPSFNIDTVLTIGAEGVGRQIIKHKGWVSAGNGHLVAGCCRSEGQHASSSCSAEAAGAVALVHICQVDAGDDLSSRGVSCTAAAAAGRADAARQCCATYQHALYKRLLCKDMPVRRRCISAEVCWCTSAGQVADPYL